jgi:hypothetical protein
VSEVTFGGNTIGDKALYLNGVERGKKDERERIIKLLRTELGPYFIWADDTPYIKGINLDGFIALIKGENK